MIWPFWGDSDHKLYHYSDQLASFEHGPPVQELTASDGSDREYSLSQLDYEEENQHPEEPRSRNNSTGSSGSQGGSDDDHVGADGQRGFCLETNEAVQRQHEAYETCEGPHQSCLDDNPEPLEVNGPEPQGYDSDGYQSDQDPGFYDAHSSVFFYLRR